jgi:hypothetical protein
MKVSFATDLRVLAENIFPEARWELDRHQCHSPVAAYMKVSLKGISDEMLIAIYWFEPWSEFADVSWLEKRRSLQHTDHLALTDDLSDFIGWFSLIKQEQETT